MTCNLLDDNTVAYSIQPDASHRIRLLSEGVWWVVSLDLLLLIEVFGFERWEKQTKLKSREHDLNSEQES